jgi:hypothetical protein
LIVFATCLRHPARSNDYGRVESLLQDTLRSVCAQDSDDFRVIVVGHVRPSFDLPPMVDFVEVDFDPPPLTKGVIARPEFRIDKGQKLAIAAAYAKRYDPTHIALFDADDFVSKRLVSYIQSQTPGGSWYIDEGFSCSASTGVVAPEPDLHLKCGTSLIFGIDDLAIPDVDPTDHGAVLAATGKDYYVNVFGSHRQAFKRLKTAGGLLRAIPFPGAVYLLDTGENHSTNTVRQRRSRLPDNTLMIEEFAMPPRILAPQDKIARMAASHGIDLIETGADVDVDDLTPLAKTLLRAERLINKRDWESVDRLLARIGKMPGKRPLAPLIRAMVAVAGRDFVTAWTLLRDRQDGDLVRLRPETFVAAAFGVSISQGLDAYARAAVFAAERSITSEWRIARTLLLYRQFDALAQLIEQVRARRDLPNWVTTELTWIEGFLAERRHDTLPLIDGPSIAVTNYRAIDPRASSTNIGDWVQTLAFMGNLARFQDIAFHMDGAPSDLMDELQRLVPERRKLGGPPAAVNLVVTSRDSSTYERYPAGTWLFTFGWYMHQLYHRRYDLPFSEDLRPIFLSFHLNARAALTAEAAAQMIRYGPVGCRDWHTVKVLREQGVPAFFSGCITTTLGNIFQQQADAPAKGLVAAVEVKGAAPAGDDVRRYHHGNPQAKTLSFLDNMAVAKNRLHEYEGLSKIYTSRLHCYLPGISMGVPVVFRPKSLTDIRFTGLAGLTPESVDSVADPIRRLVQTVVEAIVAGASEGDVYALWRRDTADLAVQQIPDA